MLLKLNLKTLFYVISLAVLSFPSFAADTTPPGAFGQMGWNNGLNQWGAVTIGQGLCLSTISNGCVAPTPPPPPTGMQLTADDGTTLLTADDGTTILTSN